MSEPRDTRARTGLTLGCWDGLHIGHRNHLRACMERCEKLIVVVMDDFWLRVGKGVEPLTSEAERVRAVREFVGDGAEVWLRRRPRVLMREGERIDVLFLGPDQTWHETPRNRRNLRRAKRVVIPRTEGVSSAQIRRMA